MAETGLESACGTNPGWVCEWMFDATDSRRAAEIADWFITRPLRIALIVALAWVANALARRAIRRLIDRLVAEQSSHPDERSLTKRVPQLRERRERASQRTVTMGNVLRSIASFAIFTVALLLCLGELGLNLAPLLAGAGIAGIAIGFGAQSLVRDVLAGMFIVIEDQYGVGDIVDLGEAKGSVERITLRTTMVRDFEGTLWVVPNGEVKRVANKSQLWARAVVDIRLAYDTDPAHASAVVRDHVTAVTQGDSRVIEPAEVLGIESLTDNAMVLRVTAKTAPGAQFDVARELRSSLKSALDAAGIKAVPPRAMPI